MSRTVTLDAYGNGAEDGSTFNGGTAEDWYNAYAELVQGKGIVERALERGFRRVSGERKAAREALAYRRGKRKRAESLLADPGVMEKVGLIESLKAENAELRRKPEAVKEAL